MLVKSKPHVPIGEYSSYLPMRPNHEIPCPKKGGNLPGDRGVPGCFPSAIRDGVLMRRERAWGKYLLTTMLIVAGSAVARGQNTTVDSLEVEGNLTVTSPGVSLAGYYDSATGYTVGAGLSVGGLNIGGSWVDAAGNILGNWVDNGGNATLDNLTAGGLVSGGGLSTGGTLHVQSTLNLGTWWNGSATHSGLTFNFADDGNAQSGQVYFTSASPQTAWVWAPSQGLAILDAHGNLSLTDNLTGNTVTMIPGNFSLVLSHNSTVLATVPVGSINATSSIFANDGTVTLGSGNIVLNGAGAPPTMGLGNFGVGTNSGGSALTFSAAGSGNTISLDAGSQAVTFSNGFSLGGNSTLTQVGFSGLGLAMGGNTTANAAGAVAMGGAANATGADSLALANGTSSGDGALAVGTGSLAAGNNSVALAGGQATGNGTVAIGVGTVAQPWGATVVGHYNQGTGGNATTWAPSDAAFVVGAGANSTAPANVLIISNNGTTTLTGNTTVTDASHQLQVNGASNFNGTVTFGGKVSLPEPLGDIPMGPFGNH